MTPEILAAANEKSTEITELELHINMWKHVELPVPPKEKSSYRRSVPCVSVPIAGVTQAMFAEFVAKAILNLERNLAAKKTEFKSI